MRISVNRLCELAGITNKRGKLLSEGKHDVEEGHYGDHSMEEDAHDPSNEGYRAEMEEGSYEMEEMDHPMEGAHDPMEGAHDPMEGAHDPMEEEILEVDEVQLVQELRRAKRLMNESKRREQMLQEMELKAVIDKEVKNVLRELNLNSDRRYDSGWVYGSRRPKRSRHGYTHQGSYIKGIGFK